MPTGGRALVLAAALLGCGRRAAGLRRTAVVDREPRLGAPPYSSDNEDLDEIFGKDYPLSPEDAAGLPLVGNYDERFFDFFEKLERGELVRILVFGGSMTAGEQCNRRTRAGPLWLETCAWPSRLVRILKVSYPKARIELLWQAHRGQTASSIAAGLGVELRVVKDWELVDLVLLDTGVNDAYEATVYWNSGKVSADPGTVVSIAYEVLVRSLKELLPRAVLVPVTAGCARCLEMRPRHLEVAAHYGLPVADFGSVTAKRPQLWDPPEWTHPRAPTHQLVADTVAGTWSRALREGRGRPLPPPAGLPAASFHTQEELDKFSVCLKPLSGYMASVAFNDPSAPRPATANGWRLFEDRPKKPGWIAEEEGATMSFDLAFGPTPQFAIIYLRSYEGLGDMTVKMGGKSAKLEGIWPNPARQRVSQAYSLLVNASRPQCDQLEVTPSPADALCFGIKPNSRATLEVVSHGPKSKVIGVLSC